ncbi:hypothetical protein Aeqsu_1030 [Aequorivita sublithincola DSM 14238]|uniref:Uncharacterized protein n=1 Tax=Aequorivita sublithincola (strain DSM 14238 / LMG 21431 / ACAM 643 / 9-3) TaxID=746697 RepID=I3YU61_AEQSU|nr:hypothetical protein [Aequorivita sublithincola]AFL80529.1 hypothetical protein Aeqsu_1030 [Aequorivita sublithincola DSM 14238]
MKLKFLSIALIMICGFAYAQDKVKYTDEERDMLKAYYFSEGFNQPATKKVSTVIMKDGSEHKGYCKGVVTKKGQIAQIVFKDSVTDNKETYDASQIAEAFLYAGGFEKFSKVSKKMSNFGMGGRNNVKKLTSNDQIYFINQKVSLKNRKDEQEFLMQLINPDFSQIISVYHDPFAKESGGFSVGGSPTFGGGVVKSYYIQKGDKVMWLPKNDLEENYEFLFGDNAEFMAKYPYKSINWDWLSALVLEYTIMSLPKE